jgi:plasminogen activator inhibitor 1 RNA-binding protein
MPQFQLFRDSDKKVHQSWGGDDGVAELKTEEAATNDATEEKAAVNDWAANGETPADDPWGAPAPASEAAPADDPWATPATAPTDGDKAAERESRPRREREPEEEDNTLTLEQYLAQKKEQDASLVPKLEVRKANDGADDSIWKDAVELKKGDDQQAYFAGKVHTPSSLVFIHS